MPNLTPADLHTLEPLGAEKPSKGKKAKRHSFAQDEDDNFKRIKANRNRPTAKATKDIPWFDGSTGVPTMRTGNATRLIQKSFHSAASRRKSAKKKHALPDGSYPIENTTDLKNAAILARSGHGNVAAARSLIARRARELGVSNPLASSGVSKSLETYAGGSVPLVFSLAKYNR